jgi:hypothetical protein
MVLEKYSKEKNDMYYVSEEMAHCLGYNLFKPFDPIYWEQLKRWTPIHKLSYYNFHSETGKIPEDITDTYYDYIINEKFNQ